jgi:hypothetical protein
MRNVCNEQSFALVCCFGGLLADFKLSSSFSDFGFETRVLEKQLIGHFIEGGWPN